MFFTMFYVNGQMNHPHTIHTVPEYQQTVVTYLHLVQYKIPQNPSIFRMKLRIFHFIMFTLFLINLAKDSVTRWFKMLLLCTLSPTLPYIGGLIYWISILFSCIGLILAESTSVFTYKPPTLSQKDYDNGGQMNLISKPNFFHPMPQYYYILSGVALLPTFTGWLIKLGKRLDGFFSSMHQIGLNTTYILSLNCMTSTSTIKEKTKYRRERCSVNIHKFLQLMVFIIFYPTTWCTSAFHLKHNNGTNMKDHGHHVE